MQIPTPPLTGNSVFDEWVQKLVAYLERPQWEDLRTPLTTAKIPAANFPGLEQVKDDGAASIGAFAYHFADGQYMFLTVQMPHSWKEGSTVYPHIHFMTTTDVSPADNFGIGLEYIWQNEDAVATATSAIEIDISTGVNSSYKHQEANLSSTGISGTGKTMSSTFIARLYRQAADTDNYAGDVIITEFDIHYQRHTRGSRGITTK